MKITLLSIGKCSFPYIKEGILDYSKRVNHFVKFECVELPDVKKYDHTDQLKVKESALVIKHCDKSKDFIILLDERGKSMNTKDLTSLIVDKIQFTSKNIIFIVGGAYGSDKSLQDFADMNLSFSAFTFSHQLMRLILAEQIYRCISLIHHLPYHHE
ncbi:MAG: 23S rRNA (pseudouridine(1915)-N(3))-methyltransferase RlmH [Bacteroidota bacterium]|nr:23S rRNA (pseudouridine(1915)-N(3))-methyltransferase RlmH [Bacteroidota bacterium]